jgi:hypothetical protein
VSFASFVVIYPVQIPGGKLSRTCAQQMHPQLTELQILLFSHSRAGGNPAFFQDVRFLDAVVDPFFSGDQVGHDGRISGAFLYSGTV